MPCSMVAAASRSLTPCGILTRRSAGTAAYSAYEPMTPAQATRSPSLTVLDLRAHRRDRTRAFLPDHERQWHRIPALAMISVNEVHARGGDLHHRFVGFGLRNRNVYKFEGFGSAGLLYLNGFHESLDYHLSIEGFNPAQLTSQSLTPASWLSGLRH